MTSHSRRNNINLPIYLVQLGSSSKPANLNKIKYVNREKIHWEKIIKKDITQCRRYQRLGHTAANCNLDFRCVKCNTDHEPGQCPNNNIEPNSTPAKPFCRICNEFGHPSSYRGCPKRKEYLNNSKIHKDRISPATKTQQQNKTTSFNKLAVANISYAGITKSSNSTNPYKHMDKLIPDVNSSTNSNSQSPIVPDLSGFFETLKNQLISILSNELKDIKKAIIDQSNRIDILYELNNIESHNFNG